MGIETSRATGQENIVVIQTGGHREGEKGREVTMRQKHVKTFLSCINQRGDGKRIQ